MALLLTSLKLENVRLRTNASNDCDKPDENHTDRSKRVKDAKSEAQKEIEEYRKQKEDEYQKYEKEVCNKP